MAALFILKSRDMRFPGKNRQNKKRRRLQRKLRDAVRQDSRADG